MDYLRHISQVTCTLFDVASLYSSFFYTTICFLLIHILCFSLSYFCINFALILPVASVLKRIV